MKRLRRVPLMAAAPLLAVVALLAWVFASPIGAGPDDDYHLVSTWCAGSMADEVCAPVEGTGRADHRIPRALAEISCFEREPAQSAACQHELFAGELTSRFVDTDRGNFYGEYPPLYYAVMSVFTSHDVQASGLVMRVFTVLLFAGILTALYLLLPVDRRPTLLIGWAVTTLPLGVFLLASNNPSAWAAIGVGTSWIALLGYFETGGARRIGLGAIYALAMLMASGSRGDAAVYAGFATALVLLYTFRPKSRGYWLVAILPVAMGLVALAFLLRAGQIGSGLGGFSDVGLEEAGVGGGDGEEIRPTGIALLAYNIMNVPFLWLGNLGEWGLGWLDTSMPAIVTFGAVASFVIAGFLGIRKLEWRKALVVGLAALVLWVLPVYVLQQSGHIVGQQVQPRYLLPLVVLLGGLLALGAPYVRWTRGQLLLVASLLSVGHVFALHTNLRRYLTGVDGGGGLNLNVGVEWWWDVPFTPMVVWITGSLAYAALLFLIAARIPLRPVAGPGAPAPRDEARV